MWFFVKEESIVLVGRLFTLNQERNVWILTTDWLWEDNTDSGALVTRQTLCMGPGPVTGKSVDLLQATTRHISTGVRRVTRLILIDGMTFKSSGEISLISVVLDLLRNLLAITGWCQSKANTSVLRMLSGEKSNHPYCPLLIEATWLVQFLNLNNGVLKVK